MEVETTVVLLPLLLVSVIDPMVMLTATNRSEGASPILTCSVEVFGWGFGEEEEEDVPPPQPSNNMNDTTRIAQASYLAARRIFCSKKVVTIFNLKIRSLC
jgi:hypothetical protein